MYVGSVSVHGIWADAGRLGLHPKDWLPTIYELLPWSFVIDYFVNLNAIIAALSNAFISVDWVSKTTRKSYVTRVTNITPRRLSPGVYPNSELIVREFSPRNSKHVVKRVDREALDGVSIPNLVFSLPDSFGQVINLLSLYVAREETRDLVKSL